MRRRRRCAARLASLEHGAHIVVGTPGRIMDHLERGSLDAGRAATRWCSTKPTACSTWASSTTSPTVARQCPKERQTLLFSATYPEGIAKLSRAVHARAAAGQGRRRSTRRGKIEQRWYEVTDSERLHAVGLLLDHFRPASTLAFCNTKQQCRELVDVLQAQGFSALALYGELEQRERDQVLVQFANRSCSVLVATDVAARGLDIAQLEAVINVDVTPDPEVHIHRIGRTGRAGEAGPGAEPGEHGRDGLASARSSSCRAASPSGTSSANSRPPASGPLQPPMATLQILGGRKEKIRAGDVLGALTGEAGLHARADRQDQRERVLDLCGRGSCCRARGGRQTQQWAHQGKERQGAGAGRLGVFKLSENTCKTAAWLPTRRQAQPQKNPWMQDLAFRTLLYRYFFFSWLFKDVTLGNLLERTAAWRHNQQQARWLLTYMRRWLWCGVVLYGLGSRWNCCSMHPAFPPVSTFPHL